MPSINPTNPASPSSYLMWFRRDLRLKDNTALSQISEIIKQSATQSKTQPSELTKLVKPPRLKALFVVTAEQWLQHDMSIAQVDFIFRTLKILATSLFEQLNIEMYLLQSATFDSCIPVINDFCQQHNITHIASNFEYEVNEQQRDSALEQLLTKQGIQFSQYHDQCILPPMSVTTNEDTMYKVFTPFYKKWQSILETSTPTLYSIDKVNAALSNPDRLAQLLKDIDDLHQQTLRLFYKAYSDADFIENDNVNNQLLNTVRHAYPAGEAAARNQLQQFLAEEVQQYDIGRDQPALEATSRLSAYLTIGAISPRLCYLQAKQVLQAIYENNSNQAGITGQTSGAEKDVQRWISELAWRDFYRHVIFDRTDIVTGNAYNKIADEKVNWAYDQADFTKWCQGKTGVPLVDAAMRCLNQTGFMHNRLRMVTAMFLTKDLFIDWRWGERYFMQQLIDGDFASNNGGWQWSASVGTDAAPYFRIMNPFSQAKTHDKQAVFIKTWLPELRPIPAKVFHDEAKLRQALSEKGEFANVDYPQPMVEHKQARLYAIEQFKG